MNPEYGVHGALQLVQVGSPSHPPELPSLELTYDSDGQEHPAPQLSKLNFHSLEVLSYEYWQLPQEDTQLLALSPSHSDWLSYKVEPRNGGVPCTQLACPPLHSSKYHFSTGGGDEVAVGDGGGVTLGIGQLIIQSTIVG